ncbi:hypothetical protein AOQ84DRAFT_220623, partial [Glonium stellatum]
MPGFTNSRTALAMPNAVHHANGTNGQNGAVAVSSTSTSTSTANTPSHPAFDSIPDVIEAF